MRMVLMLGVMFLLAPSLAYAALININTADAVTLDTLPYVTPTAAQAIVDYRKDNGPFVAIEDVQRVNGIKSGIFSHIQPLITVGESAIVPVTASTATTSAPTTRSAASVYVPPSREFAVTVHGESTALVNVPARFYADIAAKGDVQALGVSLLWSFGDGSSGTGAVVEKTFRYEGTYVVSATADSGAEQRTDTMTVRAVPAVVRIAALTGEGVRLANDADADADISGWRIATPASTFRVPSGTRILAHGNVLFPWAVMNMPVSFSAWMTFPDGTLAARFDAETPILVQPTAPLNSSYEVQTISIPEPAVTPTYHAAESISAPPEMSDDALSGGAVLAAAVAEGPASSEAKSLLASPWSFGLIGVLLLSVGAFIFL